MASAFEMIGHICSIWTLLSKSRPRISGEDIMHQAPKWARLHSKLQPPVTWLSSNMSL